MAVLLPLAACGSVAGKGEGTGGAVGTGGANGSGGLAADGSVGSGGGSGLGGASGLDAGVDGPSDAGTDHGGTTSATCDPSRPFTTIALATAFSSPQSEDGIAFSSDGLTAYVSSTRTGTIGGYDIFATIRASTSTAWGPLTSLPNVNTTSNERSPIIAPDGLTLFFYSDRGGSGFDIYSSTRPSLLSDFGVAATVAGINTTGRDDTDSISADGRTLYFDSQPPGGMDRIYRATLGANGAFMPPQEVAELNSGTQDSNAVISSDGLTIYFGRAITASGDDEDVYVARRTNVADGFGTPTAVTELNSATIDGPIWLSPDGCTLYFTSDRNNAAFNYDIYVATRSPL